MRRPVKIRTPRIFVVRRAKKDVVVLKLICF